MGRKMHHHYQRAFQGPLKSELVDVIALGSRGSEQKNQLLLRFFLSAVESAVVTVF